MVLNSGPVRRFFLDNAIRWIREFHIDGLRLMQPMPLSIIQSDPFLKELADRVHATGLELGRPILFDCRKQSNDPQILCSSTPGGYGLDAQWLDYFGDSLQALLTGERTGGYADFGRLADFTAAYRAGICADRPILAPSRPPTGHPSNQVEPTRFIAYSQMHDQVGNRPAGDRLSSRLNLEQ